MSFQNPDQSPARRVLVGKITAAHGVKGLVKILPFCEDVALLEEAEGFKITLKNPMGKFMLAEIEGVSSREAAEKIGGTELYIDKDKLPEIDDEDTFYYEDLVGLTCIDENKDEIGRVKAVLNFGAGELLEINLKTGVEVLVPFNDDAVPDINTKDSIITLNDYKRFIIE